MKGGTNEIFEKMLTDQVGGFVLFLGMFDLVYLILKEPIKILRTDAGTAQSKTDFIS